MALRQGRLRALRTRTRTLTWKGERRGWGRPASGTGPRLMSILALVRNSRVLRLKGRTTDANRQDYCGCGLAGRRYVWAAVQLVRAYRFAQKANRNTSSPLRGGCVWLVFPKFGLYSWFDPDMKP